MERRIPVTELKEAFACLMLNRNGPFGSYLESWLIIGFSSCVLRMAINN
jgi:hypothetical protein